ncbi:MAG TPA: hypothetical protein V6D23_09900 [Candidatus Obscuribacterales bacterium]
MKASAAASIPRYRQGLAEIDGQAMRGLLAFLRGEQQSSRVLAFFDALAAADGESYRLLSELETEDLLLLHERIQRCWSQISEDSQKLAIRQLYQLIAAHFFVYHVQASNDPAA